MHERAEQRMSYVDNLGRLVGNSMVPRVDFSLTNIVRKTHSFPLVLRIGLCDFLEEVAGLLRYVHGVIEMADGRVGGRL